MQSSNETHLSFHRPPIVTDADALALEELEEELLIIIGVSLPANFSTCFPHFGHTTQSASIISPQCLQNFVSLILIPSFSFVIIKKP